MERHEIDTELSAAKGLLAATSEAHLAYAGKDGTPRAIPVGFYWTGTEFVISTAETAPKVAALSARPNVALAVDGVVEKYLAAARNSMDADTAAEFEQNCRQMYDRMARIAITPAWARFYDFSVGRIPRFLKELAERNF